MKVRKFSAVIISSAYVIAVSFISIYLYKSLSNVCMAAREQLCIAGIPLYYSVPIFSAVGLVTGGLMFYLISERVSFGVEKVKEDYSESIKNLFRGVLGDNESRILNLIREEGKITQAEISKRLDMSRVKVFRKVKKLGEKGLIEKKKEGKKVNLELSHLTKSLHKD